MKTNAAKQSNPEHPGLDVLRKVLMRLRWDDQGGFVGYHGKGKWDFLSTALPQVTPEELNALMDLVGIVPDKIVSLGSCRNCAHSDKGRERGYKPPCVSCKRPRMSNFQPKPKLVQLRRKK